MHMESEMKEKFGTICTYCGLAIFGVMGIITVAVLIWTMFM